MAPSPPAGYILRAPFTPGLPLPSVGNGNIATMVSSDAVFVAGVYNGRATDEHLPSHRARIPAPQAFTVAGCGYEEAELDAWGGVFSLRGRMGQGGACAVEQRWFAHRGRPRVMVHEVEVRNDSSSPIDLLLLNEPGPPSSDIDFWEPFDIYDDDEGSGGDTLQVTCQLGRTMVPERDGGRTICVGVVSTGRVSAQSVGPSERRTFRHLACICTDVDKEAADPMDVLEEAIKEYREAATAGDLLVEEHREEWRKLWEDGRIEVEGNPDLACRIASSWYALLSSIRADRPFSLSPGGLATNGYNGHVFWDTEMWMLPNLSVFHPALARSCFQYRLDRLPEARARAQSNGYQGAMFPWESASSGLETTPTWAASGWLEQHITADIALAARWYWHLSRDRDWLATKGCALAREIADFWTSRATVRPQGGVSAPPAAAPVPLGTGASASARPSAAAAGAASAGGTGQPPYTGAATQEPACTTAAGSGVSVCARCQREMSQEAMGDGGRAAGGGGAQVVAMGGRAVGSAGVDGGVGGRAFDIAGVMPPDEFAMEVKNSVYTNVAVKLALEFAAEAAALADVAANSPTATATPYPPSTTAPVPSTDTATAATVPVASTSAIASTAPATVTATAATTPDTVTGGIAAPTTRAGVCTTTTVAASPTTSTTVPPPVTTAMTAGTGIPTAQGPTPEPPAAQAVKPEPPETQIVGTQTELGHDPVSAAALYADVGKALERRSDSLSDAPLHRRSDALHDVTFHADGLTGTGTLTGMAVQTRSGCSVLAGGDTWRLGTPSGADLGTHGGMPSGAMVAAVPPAWREVAAGLYLPEDQSRDCFLEYEGYEGKPIKQADVILLGYPLQWPMMEQRRRNDLVYYSERTDPQGPAMTWSMSAVGWLDVGEKEKADADFAKDDEHMVGPFHVWRETTYGGAPNFITGAGGWLQALWAGYAGLRFSASGLHFRKACLPPGCTKLTLYGIHFAGSKIRVAIDGDQVKLTLLEAEARAAPLVVESVEGQQVLGDGDVVHLALGCFDIRTHE